MTDQRLRDGGMWYANEPQVTCDGYLEDWGHQQATAAFGPTCNGISRGQGNPTPPGPSGSGTAAPSLRRHNIEQPRPGGKVNNSEGI